MRQSYFTPAVFKFLRELEENNDRPWFEENKERYIATIREPAKEFIADFEPRLTNISDHFIADTRTNGGSLMRPYRDTRFMLLASISTSNPVHALRVWACGDRRRRLPAR
jgi:uncharacterized protein (DUF2461 family)